MLISSGAPLLTDGNQVAGVNYELLSSVPNERAMLHPTNHFHNQPEVTGNVSVCLCAHKSPLAEKVRCLRSSRCVPLTKGDLGAKFSQRKSESEIEYGPLCSFQLLPLILPTSKFYEGNL
jgi:hypothetical protein